MGLRVDVVARDYVKITIYRAGTLDNPTDPYVIENDYSTLLVDTTMTISSLFEIRILNYHEEHTDQFTTGNIIEIIMGDVEDYVTVLGGLIFSVEYAEDSILIRGYDWTHYLVGPRITKKYSNLDYAEILRDILTLYAPSLKSNFLFDTGYILQEVYAGGYITAIDSFNDLTPRVNFDWKVRPDREAVLFPDGLQIEVIDGFNEEIDDEDPDGWTEISETWYVLSNRYYVSASAGNYGVTITDTTTTDYQDIRCVMQTITGGTGQIVGIVYDYQSSSDFKYALLFAGSDQWVLGHWDGSTNTDDSASEAIDVDTQYRVRLVIDNANVTFYVWNTDNEVWDEKCNYDYGTLGSGNIGLGSYQSIGDFDDFVVYNSGLQSIDVDTDAIGWNIAKRDFRDLINRVTVIGGKETFKDDFSSGTLWQWGSFYQSGSTSTVAIVSEELEIDCEADATAIQWTQAKYRTFTFSANIKSEDKGGGWINVPGLVVLATDDTNYYRVRMNCEADRIQVYKVISGTPTLLKETNQTFNTGTFYNIKVKITEGNIKVYVNNYSMMDFQDTTYSTGFNGLEVIDGKAQFDDIVIVTDRDVIASISDPALINIWGEKSADPIRDDAIENKDSANSRATQELNRYRFEKTRGLVKLEADISIKVGDIIELTAIDCAIIAEDYRIYGVIHTVDDDEGFVTLLKIAEDFPGLEQAIRVESARGTYLSWVGILISVLIKSIADTISVVTDSVQTDVRGYYAFYFDEEDTFGYSYWDFSSWY